MAEPGSSGPAPQDDQQRGPRDVPQGDPEPMAESRTPLRSQADPGALERLIAELQADRQWLLRQIDSGRWSEWRLDLAALERELGQLLDQLDRCSQPS
jgi:hypothetical protein